MNMLSLFIYLADTIPRLITLGGILLAVSLISGIFAPPKGIKPFSNDHIPCSGFLRKDIIAMILISAFFLILTPSKTTMYGIAASEMGEVVVKTPEAQEVLQALKEKILDQLSPEQVSKTRPNPFEE